MNHSLRDFYHNRLHHGKTTDKWERYIDAYDAVLVPYSQKEVTLVEIGIQNGGSLEVWSKFFPNFRKIIGCDINPDCHKLTYDNPNIHVIVGDANEDGVVEKIKAETAGSIDLIIDDGSHVSSDIIKTFIKYFPLLSDDGIFIIEDLHCSYWKEFEGGLYDPMSSMAFLKKLSDAINYEHWGYPGKKVNDLFHEFGQFLDIDVTSTPFDHIYSVTFFNSVCIIHKKKTTNLGKRIIVGEHQDVISLDNVLTDSHAPGQGDNYWTGMVRSPEAEYYPNQLLIEKLQSEIQSCKNDNLLLKKDIENKDKYLNEIINSKSWKMITKLRAVFKGSR